MPIVPALFSMLILKIMPAQLEHASIQLQIEHP